MKIISHEHILKIFSKCGNPPTLCFIGTNLNASSLDTLYNVSQIRLLTFDYVLSLRMLIVMLLSNRVLAIHCNVLHSLLGTIILKCPNKSCDLDPFPTLLLKLCTDQRIHPSITIINMSVQDYVVHDYFKQALVNPLFFFKSWQNWTKEVSSYFLNEFVVECIVNGCSKSSPWPYFSSTCQMIYNLHINDFIQRSWLYLKCMI